MSESTIEKIHTTCLGCHFAQVKNQEQKGCDLGLLKKFGDCVVPVYDEQDNKFFVINGRNCNFKRSSKWATGLTLAEARKRAQKEIALKVELVIYIDKYDLKALKNTIKSAVNQKLSVKAVSVINNTGDLILSDSLGEELNKFGLPWKVKNIIEEHATPHRCFDLTIKESQYPYFISCHPGDVLPKLLHKINTKINDDLEQIVAVELGKEGALFGQTFVYKVLQGNAGDYTFLQKLQELEKEENKKLVRKDTEL